MKTFSYSRCFLAALIGIPAFAAGLTASVATVGAAFALLSVPSAMPAEQSLPGAKAESVVAIAKRLNSAVFETGRRWHAVQLDLPALKVERQAKHAETERLAGGWL